MKKIKFEDLKSSILEEELNLIDDMYIDGVYSFDEKVGRKKDITEEFDLINNLNDLYCVLMGMGFDEYETYERTINHLVEETKP